MKNLLFLSAILFFISCSKKDPAPQIDTFSLESTINGNVVSFNADLCEQQGGGWSGGLTFVDSACISWITNWYIEDENSKLFIEFHIKDSLASMDADVSSNYFFPRVMTPDLAPNFYPIVKYTEGNTTYTSIKDRLEGVNPDFTLEISEADVDYSHECNGGGPLLNLKGTFSGTMFKESSMSETIEVQNGNFDVILRRYDFIEVR